MPEIQDSDFQLDQANTFPPLLKLVRVGFLFLSNEKVLANNERMRLAFNVLTDGNFISEGAARI